MPEENLPVSNIVIPTQSKFNFHKVLAAIGLILIVVIIISAGTWYYVEGKNTSTPADDSATIKVVTSSAKIATSSAKDETYSWLEYTNSQYGVSLKYPKDWTETGNLDTSTVFSKNKDSLQVIFIDPGSSAIKVEKTEKLFIGETQYNFSQFTSTDNRSCLRANGAIKSSKSTYGSYSFELCYEKTSGSLVTMKKILSTFKFL